jgi:hypothetical protein
MTLRADFLKFDDRLAALGVPPCTAWWRAGVGRWLDAYESGRAPEFYACVGRGAAKSTVLYKLALFFSLFGDFQIPPGERHWAIVLSRLKEEAAKGLAIISHWCDLLREPHRTHDDVIELEGGRGIRVVAASVAGSSGWRAYFIGKDERAKWPMGGAEEIDSEEIDTSAAAMTATHEFAPVLAFSSAWGMFGAFYEAIVGGSTESRIVLGPTPTWIAAPHISEESTRRKERDPRRWAREYLCEFQAGALSALDPDHIDAAFTDAPDYDLCERVVLVDPTAGASDTYAFAIAGWRAVPLAAKYLTRQWYAGESVGYLEEPLVDPETDEPIPNPDWDPTRRERVLVFDFIGGVDHALRRGITSDAIVRLIAREAHTLGAAAVHSDQFERFALASAVPRYGLRFVSHTWTAANKERAVERVRRWLSEKVLVLPPHEATKRQLKNFQEKIAPSGALTFKGRQGGHDDFAMLVMLAALVDIEGQMPGSPLAPAPELLAERDAALSAAGFGNPAALAAWGISRTQPTARQLRIARQVTHGAA